MMKSFLALYIVSTGVFHYVEGVPLESADLRRGARRPWDEEAPDSPETVSTTSPGAAWKQSLAMYNVFKGVIYTDYVQRI